MMHFLPSSCQTWRNNRLRGGSVTRLPCRVCWVCDSTALDFFSFSLLLAQSVPWGNEDSGGGFTLPSPAGTKPCEGPAGARGWAKQQREGGSRGRRALRGCLGRPRWAGLPSMNRGDAAASNVPGSLTSLSALIQARCLINGKVPLPLAQAQGLRCRQCCCNLASTGPVHAPGSAESRWGN